MHLMKKKGLCSSKLAVENWGIKKKKKIIREIMAKTTIFLNLHIGYFPCIFGFRTIKQK